MGQVPVFQEKGKETMNENQKSNAALPPEWYRHDVRTTEDDIEAHYDRGGIVLITKFIDGNELTNVAFCYSEEVIVYLKQIQRAGAGFDAKAYLEGIAGDIARGGLERGHALVRLMAYTLSQPTSLAENIVKHVGSEKFGLMNGTESVPPN